MARYVVGDVQGCFDELMLLLERMDYVPTKDRLFIVGDLVNRGPSSLEVLRWAMSECDHVSVVLGNHDLHLLACSVGAARCKKEDTLDKVLAAPDAGALLDWLRRQPLLLSEPEGLIVHAGILPAWDEETAQGLAQEVSATLAGSTYAHFLMHMYGNKPNAWTPGLGPMERMRLAVNAFTRMRLVDDAGALDLKFKGELDQAPPGRRAWFEFPRRAIVGRRIICGHWSALGLVLRDDLWALDTGCVWGGMLTGVRLEDGARFQVPALRQYQSVDCY
ncbi:Bis(5'nucleosyl)-tetraphosphatase, ApaH [Formivibrio citricus]|uniref:bis(5'-nucleosyl)-tetraphosphatase (symmetrical) n=1 Tax=Formivibrio citricus TaxID=83765 RepID=A0A1I4ZPS6_9NEIS|nr:symmetrical bis(5'-nucleosyl)-tetraphosphatase [Formivibrio citricus]SFN51990.1 Bis(5'nucleosyl)-tetraphosphatase, ApaH [Formivibrio citricus]